MCKQRWFFLAAWALGSLSSTVQAQSHFPLDTGNTWVYLVEKNGEETGFVTRQSLWTFDTQRGWMQSMLADSNGKRQTLLWRPGEGAIWRNQVGYSPQGPWQLWSLGETLEWEGSDSFECLQFERRATPFGPMGPGHSVLEIEYSSPWYHDSKISNYCTGQRYEQNDIFDPSWGPVQRSIYEGEDVHTESLMYAKIREQVLSSGERSENNDEATALSSNLVLLRDAGQGDKPVPMLVTIYNGAQSVRQLGPNAKLRLRWESDSGGGGLAWEHDLAGQKIQPDTSLVITDFVQAPQQAMFWPEERAQGQLTASLVDDAASLQMKHQLPLRWLPAELAMRCGATVCRRDRDFCRLRFASLDPISGSNGIESCEPLKPRCGPESSCDACVTFTAE